MMALSILLGFILDALFGDPYNMPHPVRLMGTMISRSETSFRKLRKNERTAGTAMAVFISLIWLVIPAVLMFILYRINIFLGIISEGILCYYMLAARCLRDESMKVYKAAKNNDEQAARQAVSMIVGRDTKCLDMAGIIRAAVETVAENTSDGVTAPLFWMMIGGAPLACFYKAVNTMDSMIGYKNEKYIDFGRFAAKLDDILNYIPSRLTAVLMIISAYITGMDGKNAYRIWKRDRRNHASPNSAQTESVCAGALDVRLAGDAYYFGKLVKKPYIGDDIRPVEAEDIPRANRLMYCTAVLMLIISAGVRAVIFGGII